MYIFEWTIPLRSVRWSHLTFEGICLLFYWLPDHLPEAVWHSKTQVLCGHLMSFQHAIPLAGWENIIQSKYVTDYRTGELEICIWVLPQQSWALKVFLLIVLDGVYAFISTAYKRSMEWFHISAPNFKCKWFLEKSHAYLCQLLQQSSPKPSLGITCLQLFAGSTNE